MWSLVVLIFAAGLVLPVWWVAGASPPDLPGLPAYPSAYVGDTVLIPVTCLLLALGVKALPQANGERRLAGGAALAAATAGVVVQAVWLADPDPELNWTLTRPGHFSAPGWWHAGYFVAASAVTAGLATLFLFRTRNARLRPGSGQRGPIGGPGAAAVITAMGSYLGLVVHDNSGGIDSLSSASSLITACIALALVIAAVLVSFGRSIVVLARPALVAAGTAPAIVLLATTSNTLSAIVSSSGAVLVCTTIVISVEAYLVLTAPPASTSFRGWAVTGTAALFLLCAASGLSLWPSLEDAELQASLIYGLVFALLFTLVLAGMLGHRVWNAMPVTAVGLLVVAVTAASVWSAAEPTSSTLRDVQVLPILVGIVVGLAALAAKARTDGELGVPGDIDQPGPRLARGAPSVRAGLALGLLAALGLDAFLATLHIALASTGHLDDLSMQSSPGLDLPGDSLSLFVASAYFVALALLAVNLYAPRSRIASTLNLIAPLGASLAVTWHLVAGLGDDMSFLAVCTAVAVALWTFNSTINNSWLLQGRPVTVSAFVTSCGLAVVHGVVAMWLLTVGINDGDGTRHVWDAVLIAFCALVVATGFVSIMGSAEVAGRAHCTELPPWRYLVQDGLSCSAIVLFLVFPVAYFWSATNFWTGVATAAPIVTFFAIGFGWIVNANRNWPRIEAHRVTDHFQVIASHRDADLVIASLQGPWWRRLLVDQRNLRDSWRSAYQCGSPQYVRTLVAHTRNQNRLAVAMLVVAISGTLPLIFQLATDNGRISALLGRMMTPR